MTVGYNLVETATGQQIDQWGGIWGQCTMYPNPLVLPNGDHVCAAEVDVEYSGYKLVPWVMDEPLPAIPESITRRQCAIQLLTLEMITAAEAIEMSRSGMPPASVQSAFDKMPDPKKTMALIDFAATSYYRSNPLIPSLMEADGMTNEQVDQFFIDAVKR